MSGELPFILDPDRPLTPEIPARTSYPQRIERAEMLMEHSPASAELMRFYMGVAFAQQHVFQALTELNSAEIARESWGLLLDKVVPLFPAFVRAIAKDSPSAMRDRASAWATHDAIGTLLTDFWSGTMLLDQTETAMADRCLALAFLQPYAEWLAHKGVATNSPGQHATCPVCSSEPMCAVLRDQDHGSRRDLICSLCMHEWVFPRVLCPSCGEKRFEELPVFTPEADPSVRVDACETCKRYIKTVDMTEDGLAVPVVDELAAASLDLWARERGYTKLVLNLAAL